MKKLLLLACLLFSFTEIRSCPACNIHNHLGGSVYHASAIYKAKVVKIKRSKMYVEIGEYIKGPVEGVKIKNGIEELSISRKYSGYKLDDELIILNYRWPPVTSADSMLPFQLTFDELPGYMEEEIRFLADSGNKIQEFDEAFRLLCGVSYSTVGAALEYFKLNYDKVNEELWLRIREQRMKIYHDSTMDYRRHKSNSLARAAILDSAHWSLEFVLNELDQISQLKEHSIPEKGIGYIRNYIPTEGEYLSRLLFQIQGVDKAQHIELVSRIKDMIIKESTINVSSLVYALNRPDKIPAIEEIPNVNLDGVALGLVFLSYSRTLWWDQEEALALLISAKEYAQDEQLVNYLQDRIDLLSR